MRPSGSGVVEAAEKSGSEQLRAAQGRERYGAGQGGVRLRHGPPVGSAMLHRHLLRALRPRQTELRHRGCRPAATIRY